MSYTLDLLTGLAVDLDAHNVGVYQSDVEIPHPEGTRGIVLHQLPEHPREVIAIARYAEDEIGTYRRDIESVVSYVQIRLRLDNPDDGATLQERIRDLYHRRRRTLTGDDGQVAVTGRQVSRGDLGFDANDRALFTQNFAFTGLRERTV